MLGERDVNLEPLRAIPKKNRMKSLEGWNCRYLGEILLNLGGSHISEAEHWIKKAIEADERNGRRWHLASDYALYADLFKRKGELSRAKETLAKAMGIFQECGADGWVKKTEEELAMLSN